MTTTTTKKATTNVTMIDTRNNENRDYSPIKKVKLTDEQRKARKQERAKKLFDAMYSNNMVYVSDSDIDVNGNKCYVKLTCKVFKNGNNYSVMFTTINPRAYMVLTSETNNGIHIGTLLHGGKYNGNNGYADFAIAQAKATHAIDVSVVRNITRGLNFTEFLSIVLQCSKKDGSTRYTVEDITGNEKKIMKYFVR